MDTVHISQTDEEVARLRAEVDRLTKLYEDQLDTAMAYSVRNAKLEQDVLSHVKGQIQAERQLQIAREGLAAKDREIALLVRRQAEKPKLVDSAAPVALTPVSDLPPPLAKETDQ